jgi:phosphoribosyl 1,2-cyclic phosphodiesterase
MKINFWGTRGSISAPGRERIKYGGHTTCVSVELADGSIIIIDGGTGIKDLSDYFQKNKPELTNFNVLMTHAHWDHVIGFPFFLPVYFKKNTINFYGTSTTHKNVKKLIAHVWDPPFFPVPFESLKAKFNFYQCRKCKFIEINHAKITTIPLSHPNGGVGYKIEENNKTFVFLTDNELSFQHNPEIKVEDYAEFARGADLLVHDGQYSPKDYKITRGWGHSVYLEACELALKAGVKKLALTHHDYNHSDKDIDGFVKEGKAYFRANKSRIQCLAARDGLEITL